jgi:hypothetical protein
MFFQEEKAKLPDFLSCLVCYFQIQSNQPSMTSHTRQVVKIQVNHHPKLQRSLHYLYIPPSTIGGNNAKSCTKDVKK